MIYRILLCLNVLDKDRMGPMGLLINKQDGFHFVVQ